MTRLYTLSMPIRREFEHEVVSSTCAECRHREVYPDVLETYSTSMDHDGRSYSVTVKDFEVTKCRKCGAIAFGNEGAPQAEQRATD